MPGAAFFDLDLTLITINSGVSWVNRERRAGRIGMRQMAQATVRFVLYRLSLIDMDEAMRLALALYKGLPAETLAGWTREWYEEEVASTFAPGGFPVMAEHRQQGRPLVLLTTSSPFEAALVKEQLDLDLAISTTYEVQDGLLTGEPILPLCYGQGKVTLAQRYADEQGIDLAQSYFYTDSYTDRPMLDRVGHPHVVNPDFRLKRYANKKGWPVLNWQ